MPVTFLFVLVRMELIPIGVGAVQADLYLRLALPSRVTLAILSVVHLLAMHGWCVFADRYVG